MKTRVLVVDDTAVFRRAISDALAEVPDVEVIGAVSNGKLAMSRIAAAKPDLVSLDIEMPEMNGLEVLEALKDEHGGPGVILLSALTVRGGEMTMRGLELGAFDFVTKPQGGTAEENRALLRSRLTPIVRAFQLKLELGAKAAPDNGATRPPAADPKDPVKRPGISLRGRVPTLPPMVLIGVSTGGPVALGRLLPDLPADIGAPVFVVQHMPSLFTAPLAASLAAKTLLRVKEAADGEVAVSNCVYLAQGGRQMKLVPGTRGEVVIRITDDPQENHCRPSVDYLFRSAALNFPGRAVAVVLTGMGNDGTEGLRLLKRTGCASIAQDEATSVVFGMPREAIHAGLVDQVLPLPAVAPAIVRCLRESAG